MHFVELSSYSTDGSGQEWKHFDSEGYLTPVVNPRAYGEQGEKSPEGQAFVLGMQTAYREWVQKGSIAPPARPVGISNSGSSLLTCSGMALIVPIIVCAGLGGLRTWTLVL